MSVIRFLFCGLCCAAAAGCSRGGVSSTLPAAPANRTALAPFDAHFDSLYSFKNVPDGAYPYAALTLTRHLLYGTTSGGGNKDAYGTVFQMTTLGVEAVLHAFKGPPDGSEPMGRVTATRDALYGTTAYGGAYNDGTIFELRFGGRERVVHSFVGTPDGAGPYAGLTALDNTFYGTTIGGGTEHVGTVFSLSPSDKERVLYSFKLGTDGASPSCDLFAFKGTLYGTTSAGGTQNWGTVFSLTPAGKEHVLYSFRGGADGATPDAGLIAVKGLLYGTTAGGGGTHNAGTIFTVTTSGRERVLHRFRNAPDDGDMPVSALTPLQGKIYGTTAGGGAYGCGTVFSITSAGIERTVHSFDGYGGCQPQGALLGVNGILYGTTYYGGDDGAGTVFGTVP